MRQWQHPLAFAHRTSAYVTADQLAQRQHVVQWDTAGTHVLLYCFVLSLHMPAERRFFATLLDLCFASCDRVY